MSTKLEQLESKLLCILRHNYTDEQIKQYDIRLIKEKISKEEERLKNQQIFSSKCKKHLAQSNWYKYIK